MIRARVASEVEGSGRRYARAELMNSQSRHRVQTCDTVATRHDVQTICTGGEMAKTSRETAQRVEDMGVMEGRYSELDGYTVAFESFRDDADATPLFRGLPDDRCQSPHWGYVFSGRVTFKFADHDEVYEAGDAYYASPGHVPVIEAGTEIVEFSPTEEYAKTMAVLGENLAAAQA
jgi:hypothetical protein